MLNELSGEILLENGLVIGPKLTLDAFRSFSVFQDSVALLDNNQWCTYKVDGLVISRETFIIILYFHNSILNKIDMAIIDPKLGLSWADWSKENELKRDQRHKEWLRKNLGLRQKFKWGNIWAGFDEKSGGSLIQIKYNQ